MTHTSHRRVERRRAAGRRLIALLVATLAVVTGFFILKVWGVVDQPSATATIQAIGDTGPDEGSEDGNIPLGESISLSSAAPAVANLDSALLEAMRDAAVDARRDGIELRVTSGWRSAEYQRDLFDRAVVTQGSEEAARRLVKPPDESTHVEGTAIDIGPTDADYWLIEHGAEYGLCQIYANEIWHFELATEPGGVCPEMIMDASVG